jgi:hypothetical protein
MRPCHPPTHSFANTYIHLHEQGPLGAKRGRLQGGWARCDPNGTGEFNWGWLDESVHGALVLGVHPWIELSYGNPAYECPRVHSLTLLHSLPLCRRHAPNSLHSPSSASIKCANANHECNLSLSLCHYVVFILFAHPLPLHSPPRHSFPLRSLLRICHPP